MSKREYKNKDINVLNSDSWRTPQWLFNQLHAEFDFEIDLCADHDNHKLPVYYTKEQDALRPDHLWNVTGFANVPYSSPKPFVIKAHEQAWLHKTTHVLLVKCDTSTNWWYQHALQANEVRFLTGRLKFEDENNRPFYPAKWGSALLIFSYRPAYNSLRRLSWVTYKEGFLPRYHEEYKELSYL